MSRDSDKTKAMATTALSDAETTWLLMKLSVVHTLNVERFSVLWDNPQTL